MSAILHRITSAARAQRGLLILSLCLLIGGAATINNLCLYTPDSTRYLAWSVSLAHGDGFRDETSPERERYVIHAPLYAVLLAPVALFTPYNISAAKVLTLCFGLVTIILLYRLLVARIAPRSALIGTGLLAVNSLFLLFSTEVLSDVPFVALIIGVFLLLERDEPLTARRGMWLAVLLAAGVLLRELGVALVGAVTIMLLLRREYRWSAISLLVPAAVYLVWWYRNELVIAPVELPALTNARLFTAHFFTPPDSSLLSELFARASANIGRYVSVVSGLVFFPVYATPQFDVVSRSTPLIAGIFALLAWAKYPLGILSGVLVLIGAVADRNAGRPALLRLLFLGFYLLVILAYPINDVRFLLPLLVLAVFYIARAVALLDGVVRSAVARGTMLVAGVVLLVPLCVWNWVYISNSLIYQRAPAIPAHDGTVAVSYPSHFMKPLPVVGEWLCRNSSTDDLVLSQWKDLAASLGGRKLMNVDQTLPSEEFDAVVRDYRVRYLVTVRQKNGLREFEYQMSQSRRFAFELRYAVSSLEVYEVRARGGEVRGIDSPFSRAFASIGIGSYTEAAAILDSLRRNDPLNFGAMFYTAVAKACAGDEATARELFRTISTLPQAGMFLEQARQHQLVLADLEASVRAGSLQERSDRLAAAGMKLWNLGIRKRGAGLIYAAAAADSTNLASMALAALFAIEEGNIPGARDGMQKLSRVRTEFPLGQSVLELARSMDSVRFDRTARERSRRFSVIGGIFARIGLVERAIDLQLGAIAQDPAFLPAYEALSKLYERKHRSAPEYACIRELLSRDPSRPEALARREILRERFE